MNLKQCQSCVYCDKASTPSLCRFGPPTLTHIPVPQQDTLGRVQITVQSVTGWPPVALDGWCGQWKGKFELASGAH